MVFLYGENFLVKLKPFYLFTGLLIICLKNGNPFKAITILLDALKLAKQIKLKIQFSVLHNTQAYYLCILHVIPSGYRI